MKVPVSVVIPCYNSERFLRETIQSVQSQTYQADEIIVVDNNCTDKTVEIAEEMGTTVVKQPKQGLPCARNKGIETAKNEWIAIVDSDDVWLENKIELQWKAIEKFPQAELVSCHFVSFIKQHGVKKIIVLREFQMPADFDRSKTIIDETYGYAERIYSDLYSWFPINASTALINTKVFEKVGLFDENLAFREEIEFFMRALSASPIAVVSEKLTHIRLHNHNMGQDSVGLMDGHLKVIKRIERFPDNFAPDSAEYLKQWYKRYFFERGRDLFRRRKELEKSE